MIQKSAPHGLVRSLGLRDVTSFGISATLGSGILISVGYMAKFHTGPSVAICFALIVLVVLLSALCFAEFAGKVHTSGVGYAYATHVFGDLVGFCVGVITFVSYCFGSAAGARGFAQYLGCFVFAFTGTELPGWMIGTSVPESPFNISVIAPCLCGLATLVSVSGAKNSAFVSNALVLMNLSLMVIFIIYGASFYADLDLLSPLTIPSIGWRGVVDASGSAFFCLIGWELTCSLSEEVKRPSRNLPTGIISALIIVGFIYCAVSLTLSVMVPYDLINIQAPVAYAFLFHGDARMYLVVSFVASTVCVSNVLSSSIGTPRIVYAMARDGHLFDSLATLSPSTNVPFKAAILCGVINMIGSGLFDFESLAKITSCMTLMIYACVSGGVLVLRKHSSHSSRTILIPALILFSITSLSFQFNLLNPTNTLWIFGVINLISAILVFVIYPKTSSESPLLKPLITVGFPDEENFNCPLVPAVPLLAVWTNLFVIASMGFQIFAAAITLPIISALYYKLVHHQAGE
jgi:APA family basic amino acid/polyamine antiporter